MDNQEKEKASKVFTAVWDITRRYAFIPLDDFLWERFVEEMESKSQEFRQVDDQIWHLYRGIIGAVQDYKIAKEKERKNGNRQEVQQAQGMDVGRNQQT